MDVKFLRYKTKDSYNKFSLLDKYSLNGFLSEQISEVLKLKDRYKNNEEILNKLPYFQKITITKNESFDDWNSSFGKSDLITINFNLKNKEENGKSHLEFLKLKDSLGIDPNYKLIGTLSASVVHGYNVEMYYILYKKN